MRHSSSFAHPVGGRRSDPEVKESTSDVKDERGPYRPMYRINMSRCESNNTSSRVMMCLFPVLWFRAVDSPRRGQLGLQPTIIVIVQSARVPAFSVIERTRT
jgi:hypothetical protein